MYNVLIIGGGASGMMAAIAAARQNAAVVLIERMQRVGKKLLATGNGRCNLSNLNTTPACYHGTDPEFVVEGLRHFTVEDTLHFFKSLGIHPHIEEDGKIYPRSLQAGSVLDVLRHEMEHLGVQVICDKRVQQVQSIPKGFTCLCTDGTRYSAQSVVLAAGGQAAPNLGSNGGGIKIAQNLGHTITPTFPALVQVHSDAACLKRLKGLKVDGRATVYLDQVAQRTETGELLFTDYGLSGPPILQLSRIVAANTTTPQDITIALDLFPEGDTALLCSKLKERISSRPDYSAEFFLVGFLHKRLIPILLHEADITDLQARCDTLSNAQCERLATCIKDFCFSCTGVHSFMNAQVTAGGILTKEIDPITFESRIHPGLYCTGEVLDIDGDCGGYNLQWAWTSGHLAGTHAAKRNRT